MHKRSYFFIKNCPEKSLSLQWHRVKIINVSKFGNFVYDSFALAALPLWLNGLALDLFRCLVPVSIKIGRAMPKSKQGKIQSRQASP
jgi:hypothetical protein